MANTQVPSELIATNAISGTIIADNAITSVHIGQNQVTAVQIPDGSITATQIAADAVGATELAASSVVTASIQDDQVTGDKLTNNITVAGTLAAGSTITSGSHVIIPATSRLYLDGSGDTFIEETSANEMTFTTQNSERVRIDADGKVGIGTNDPDRLLTLQGDNSYMWIKDAGGGNVGFIGGSGENDGLMRLYKGDHNAKVEIHSDADSYFNGGLVGIGTSSPTDIIHTSTSFNTVGRFESTDATAYIRINDTDDSLYVTTAGQKGSFGGNASVHANNLNIDLTNGNVGIGVTGPGHTLEVSGDIEFSKAGNGNNPIMHVIDTADTECAWFEGRRAGDTGAFISVWHNPSTPQETNRSGIRFQADDDAGNKTTYAMMTMYIDDHTDGSEDGQVQIAVVADGTLEEKVRIDADLMRFRGDGGSSFIRVDNRADGHDTGFEIYQNNSRKWEIYNDDSHDNQLDFRPGGNTEAMCIRQTGQVRIGVAPDIGGVLTVQKSNAGVPVLYAKNTNADSLGIRAEVNNNTSNNAIIEAINTDGTQWKIRNDGDHFGTDTSIGSLSDSRLKKDVTDLTYDIAKFKQYRPVEFNWINPGLHKSASGKSRGFLAQEVKALDEYYVDQYDAEGDDIPLVDSDGKAYSTKFGYKDAMYISVIKQLITRLETAEAKIAVLEG
jgi:hypothetical protein